MSNIAAANAVTHRHLFHCAAVALALATAFVVVSMPKPDAIAAGTTDHAPKAAEATACLQTWPYYERSCLRDNRRRDGNDPTVRVIAINGQAPQPTSHR
jgi:hypothetical protein